MATKQPGIPDEPEKVDLILADYLWRMESGEQIDRDEFLGRHPDHEASLRAFFEDRDRYVNGVDLISSQGAAAPWSQTVASEVERIRQLGPGAQLPNVMLPKQLDDYQLIREIGRGGMGAVFLARQISLNRIVAVKVLLSGKLANDQAVGRFLREARAAARLNHPGIVTVHGVHDEDGLWYMVMEFISGSSLDQLIQKSPLETRRAAEYVTEVSDAVHYAHTEGVLHRDLKPSNVMISPEGQPKISDFGLAKITSHAPDLTSTGMILGTPSYMAPEQIRLGSEVSTVASDVYSIGAILYECLTGRPPFRAGSTLETMNQVCEDPPALPSLLNPNIPRGLETICLKCLCKSPAQRYESAGELAADLRRFLQGKPISARRPGPLAALVQWCRQRPAVAALIATAAASLLAMATFTTTHAQTVRELNARLTQSLYAADMYVATEALHQIDTRRVTTMLDRYAKTDLDEVRGFEWHHLERMTRIRQTFAAAKDHALYSISFSNDAEHLAICGASGLVELYPDPPASGVSRSFETDQGEVNKVAFSPDDRILATAGDDGTVRLWDFATLQEIRCIRTGMDGQVYSAIFTPDGSSVVVCGTSADIEIYRVDDGQKLATLTGQHERAVQAIDLSEDGQRLVSVSSDGTAIVWDLPSASVVCDFKEHTGRLTAVDLSGQGRLAISGCLDGTARIWDANTGEQLTSVQRIDGIQSVAISPNGRRFAVADRGGAICLFALSTENPNEAQPFEYSQIVWQAHVDRVYGLTFGHSDDAVLSAARDGSFCLWNVPDRSGIRVLPEPLQIIPEGSSVSDSVEFHRESSRIVQARDGAVLAWAAPFELPPATTQISAESVELIEDDRELAVGTDDGDVVILDADDLTKKRQITVQPGASITWIERRSAERTILALAHTSGTDEQPADRRLWMIDLSNGQKVQIAQDCDRFAVSQDGHLAAFNSTRDNSVTIIDMRSSETLATIKHHRDAVASLEFSPDDRYLITASHDRSAVLWNTGNWEQERALFATGSRYDSVAFSPDGKTIATGDRSGKLILWQVATGRQVYNRQFDGKLSSLMFSPAGSHLAVVRSDNRIVLLDGTPN